MLLLPLYTQNYIITPNITAFQKATRGKRGNKCSKHFILLLWVQFLFDIISKLVELKDEMLILLHEIMNLTPLSHHSWKIEYPWNNIQIYSCKKKNTLQILPKSTFIWVSFQTRNLKNNPKSKIKKIKIKIVH